MRNSNVLEVPIDHNQRKALESEESAAHILQFTGGLGPHMTTAGSK